MFNRHPSRRSAQQTKDEDRAAMGVDALRRGEHAPLRRNAERNQLCEPSTTHAGGGDGREIAA